MKQENPPQGGLAAERVADFSFYEKAGGLGKPFLRLRKGKLGYCIQYSEGCLFHDSHFRSLVAGTDLQKQILRGWKMEKRLNALPIDAQAWTGCHSGHISGLPEDCANMIYSTIKHSYSHALRQMLRSEPDRIEGAES